ncbi:hypothetical protein ACQP2E_14745 [Actinoplanes sp. CA-015351]|uniref:hypothetical protein n=1 Tax=Actinoplanes sp. CA-015351 TaxID=3239897 RepID=UPI003D992DF9
MAARHRWRMAGLVLLGIIGLACLIIGVERVYFPAPAASPPTILIVVGALLLVGPWVLHRLETIAVGPNRFELQLAQQIAEQGAPKAAALLDHTELARLVESYTVIREELDGDECRAARVQVQDSLVRRAAGFACRHEFDPVEVRQLFPRAAPVVRVLLIALMMGDPRLLDAGVLGSAIAYAASRNERFHALKVVQWHWPRLKRPERMLVLDSINVAELVIKTDSDVHVEAEKVRALGQRPRAATAD